MEDVYRQLARQFEDGRRAARQQVRGERDNPEQMRQLVEEVGLDAVESVLDAYCRHCSYREEVRLKLPTVNSVKYFRERFDWIRNVLDRHDLIRPVEDWAATDNY